MTTQPTPKPVTRIDLESIGDRITRVSYWREGWREGDPEDSTELIQQAIYRLLMTYEDQGYTCEMASANLGRALRGRTVRVDFLKRIDGWHLLKYCYGWTAKTKPISDQIKTEADIQSAVKWCEDNGWNVRKWEGGVRAFKDEPRPVRDANGIRAMRRRAEEELRRGYNLGSNKIFYDFAYDY